MKIRRGQIYKNKNHDSYVIITGKSNDKWKAKVLTDKPGVYKGTHTLALYTLMNRYELVE